MAPRKKVITYNQCKFTTAFGPSNFCPWPLLKGLCILCIEDYNMFLIVLITSGSNIIVFAPHSLVSANI